MVVALTGDQKENPPWDHLLCSADTLLEQNLPLLSTASPTLAWNAWSDGVILMELA